MPDCPLSRGSGALFPLIPLAVGVAEGLGEDVVAVVVVPWVEEGGG